MGKNHYEFATLASQMQRSDLRADVWDKTGGRCWYCGIQTNPWRDFSIDHVIPQCEGGTEDPDNLVPCCRSCNTRKKGRPLERLRQILGTANGPLFSPAQLEYLQSQGITVPGLNSYRFYFEQLETSSAER